MKDAVDAIKRGASDFIAKPFQFDELMHVLQKAIEQRRLKSENAYLRSQLEERVPVRRHPRTQPSDARAVSAARNGLAIGEHHPDHRRDRTRARKSSRARFITAARGAPTGSSRSIAARFRKRCSKRSSSATCRARSPGAVGTRQGRIEQAHKGTLFLDEVGTMSTALQMKLLRALQEREFERVGDNHTIKVDVRFIAATNSDLAKMVAEGTFREDLYYRLNVIPMQLPPLRDRRDDIPLLVTHFLEKFAPGTGMHVSQAAMRGADGLQLARQRAAARECRGTRGRARRRSQRDRHRGSARRRSSPLPQTTSTPFVDFPDDGLDLPALSVVASNGT